MTITAKTPNPKLRVVIVGGSVAGLTLAHSLHRAGIDYIVLESRDRIDPQIGASLGLFSNGSRVLDQLGLYEAIEECIEPPIWHNMLTGHGELVQKADSLELIEVRTGYPVAFLERRRVLQILYDGLPDKSKILTGKKVVSVDTTAKIVTVVCEDGSEYTGDIVAGADGVHSKVKKEMWRLAENHTTRNGLQYLTQDQNAMFSEYRCLFGMSSPVPGLQDKEQYRTFNKDWSFLVVVGKDSRVYWFVFEKLDKKYQPPNMPRYNNQEAEQAEFVKPFLNRRVSETVDFDVVWKRRTATTLTVLEELYHNHWTYERIVCLGDSIHKMTPNIGQGGNWAIESAAALTNHLHTLVTTTPNPPSLSQIRTTLKSFEQSRLTRTKEVCTSAGFATRLEAFSTPLHKLFSLYVAPNAGDMLVDVHCQAISGAPKLNFLPLPPKSIREGTIFHAQAAQMAACGTDERESPAWRAFLALPILGLCYGFQCYGGMRSLSSTPGKTEIMGLMSTLVPLQIIGTVESLRRGNNFTLPALWPVFLFIEHWWSGALGYTIPLYFFLHYIQASPERFAAPDNRLVPTHHAKTVLVGVAVGYVLPILVAVLGDGGSDWSGNILWKLAPVTTLVVQRVFASFVENTTASDRIKNPTADLKGLRRGYVVSGLISAAAYLYLWGSSGYSVGSLLWGSRQEVLNFVGSTQLLTVGSGLVWELLHFRDLKNSGRLKASWLRIFWVLGATAAFFGPGAALEVGWGWREEMLARKIQLGPGVGDETKGVVKVINGSRFNGMA